MFTVSMYSNKQARWDKRDKQGVAVSYLVVVVQLDRVPLTVTDPSGNKGMDHGLSLSWRRARKWWGEREREKEGERKDRKDKRDEKRLWLIQYHIVCWMYITLYARPVGSTLKGRINVKEYMLYNMYVKVKINVRKPISLTWNSNMEK